MVKCGRRCCICRRFDPVHLQVHHIVQKSEGGTDDADNLIAVCLTCHSDVHANTELTRRFTAEELKGHRNSLLETVRNGDLPPGRRQEEDHERLVQLVKHAFSRTPEPHPLQEEALSEHAVQLLLNAVHSGGLIVDPTELVYMDSATPQVREAAKWKSALEELQHYGLVDLHKGVTYRVTHRGFLMADQILAEAQDHGDSGALP